METLYYDQIFKVEIIENGDETTIIIYDREGGSRTFKEIDPDKMMENYKELKSNVSKAKEYLEGIVKYLA